MVGPGLGWTRANTWFWASTISAAEAKAPRPRRRRISALSSYDQAKALSDIRPALRIRPLHAIVGASYGGMVALCFAERYAALVNHIVVLSAADRGQVLSTAVAQRAAAIVREAIARG